MISPDITEDKRGGARPLLTREDLQRRLSRGALSFAVGADDYVGSRLHELLGASLADAAAAAGYQCDFIGVSQTCHEDLDEDRLRFGAVLCGEPSLTARW